MSLCRYAGCKPNNVWSGLENFRTHESVGELLVDAEDGTSMEPVTDARWLVLWAFSATSSLEGDWFTLAPYYFLARNSSWIVSRSIPRNGFDFCREKCHVHGDRLQLHRNKGRLQGFELHRGHRPGKCHGYKDVSTESKQTLMTTVVQHPVSIDIQTDQCSFQSYSSGVLNASRGVMMPQLTACGVRQFLVLRLAW